MQNSGVSGTDRQQQKAGSNKRGALTNDFSCETESVPHRDQERLIDKSVTTSPAASDRKKPICGAYHIFSVPDSSIDHSLVRWHLVIVAAGPVTVLLNATIWPMYSA